MFAGYAVLGGGDCRCEGPLYKASTGGYDRVGVVDGCDNGGGGIVNDVATGERYDAERGAPVNAS